MGKKQECEGCIGLTDEHTCDGWDTFQAMKKDREDMVPRSRLTAATLEIEQWKKLAWLAAQDWVFWSTYNDEKKDWDDGAYPVICTNDIFAPAADAYGISFDDVDEVYDAAKSGGYKAIIDWIIARTGWKRWHVTTKNTESTRASDARGPAQTTEKAKLSRHEGSDDACADRDHRASDPGRLLLDKD